MKKREKGSISIYVLSACMLVLAVLVSVYAKNQNKLNSQKRQQKIIESQYSDDSKIDEIYNRAIAVKDTGYVSDGLVLYLDGINNTGNGHDSNATVWKDLSGNGNDGTLSGFDSIDWQNGLKFSGTNSVINIPYEQEFEDITVQIIAQEIPATQNYGFHFADVNNNRLCSCHLAWTSSEVYFDTAQDRTLERIYSNAISERDGAYTFLKSTKLGQKIYKNSELIVYEENQKLPIGNVKNIYLGNKDYTKQSYRLQSFRVYNRTLTEEEIKHNYEIDKERFGIE